MNLVLKCLVGVVAFLAIPSSSVYAQRYLSEFVGTSTLKSSVSTAQVSSQLEFTELVNRRLEGSFSVSDRLQLGSDQFSVSGTLASSGNCNVQLQKTNSSGGLNLVEIPFDDSSFALIGKVNVTYNAPSVLNAGRYTGALAVVRPVADPVPIRTSELGGMVIESDVTKAISSHGLALTSQDSSLAVTGSLLGTGLLANYQVSISSSSRWTYIVGQNGSRFLAARVPTSLTTSGGLDGFVGDYGIYDSSGRLVDFGTIAGD